MPLWAVFEMPSPGAFGPMPENPAMIYFDQLRAKTRGRVNRPPQGRHSMTPPSECLRQPCLLKDAIGCVTALDGVLDREVCPADRAVPDRMFTGPDVSAAIPLKDFHERPPEIIWHIR